MSVIVGLRAGGTDEEAIDGDTERGPVADDAEENENGSGVVGVVRDDRSWPFDESEVSSGRGAG